MVAVSASTDASAPRWPWRALASLATAAAILLLGIVVAHWGWRWLAPVPPALAPPPIAERWSAAIAAAPLFGRAAAPSAGATPASVADAAPSELRLLGIFAEKNGAGYALFRLRDRGPVLVRAGAEVTNDVTLLEVRRDSVRVRERGATRDIDLRTQASARASGEGRPATEARASGTATGDSRATLTACAPPPGFKGPVYRLNAELLTGIASRPESWKDVLVPVAGGLSIRDSSGFASMLGMRRGDKMTQANGIALNGVDDVLVAFVNPLVASQPVHVAGVRNGKPADWLFVNAGACPG